MSHKSIRIAIVLVLVFGAWALGKPLQQDAGPDGIVSVEAENFDTNVEQGLNRWELTGPQGAFTGRAGMQAVPEIDSTFNRPEYLNESQLEYEVEFVKTGTHYVWVRGWGPNGDADSCYVGVDRDDSLTTPRIVGFTTYGWHSTLDSGRATIQIATPGLHIITLYMREDSFIADKLVLTTSENFSPFDDGPPESPRGSLLEAAEPVPASEAMDVPYNTSLSWKAGERAVEHDIYFGQNFDDVNNAAVGDPAYVATQAGTTYTPEGLDFGQTYYWRIDGVNDVEPGSPAKGSVWSFAVESMLAAVKDITVSASSSDIGADKAIDGSGLNADGEHYTSQEEMWRTLKDEADGAWIQFDFGKAYKLHQVHIWNHNSPSEDELGYGFKDTLVETSLDGQNWTVLKTVSLAQAPGLEDYTGETLSLDGVAARWVRMTAQSNFGGSRAGLSEVRFDAIPTQARNPQPAAGATDVPPLVTLGWLAGREANQHEVRWGTDAGALTELAVVATPSHEISVDLNQTIYWQVTEVNTTDTSAWQGDVWNFTTAATLLFDDMEGYEPRTDDPIWETWMDGSEFGTNDPENGSTVGADPVAGNFWSAIDQGRGQSLPIWIDNTAVSKSEATRTLDADWTQHGIQGLSLAFRRGADNTGGGEVTITINDKKVVYQGVENETDGIPDWTAWHIDLSTLGIDLTKVTKLTIGVEGAGAQGVLYIDDLELYKEAPVE